MYRVKIDVTLKKSILDPQGKVVCSSLHSMGFSEVSDVRVGKFIDLTIDSESKDVCEAQVHEVCDKLLVNPVIEEYTYNIEKI